MRLRAAPYAATQSPPGAGAVRAWWTQFVAINKSVFRLKGDDFSYFSLIGLAVFLAVDAVAAFSAIYLWFLKFAVGLLLSDAMLRTRVLAEAADGHLMARLLFMLSVMLGVYLVVFVGCAPQVLARQAHLAALGKGSPEALHEALGKRIGVENSSITRRSDIINLDGDCKVIQFEELKVTSLELPSYARTLYSDSSCKMEDPIFEVKVPPSVKPEYDTKDKGGRRLFTATFTPPLSKGSKATIYIQNSMQHGFYMAKEDLPTDWDQTPGMEFMGHEVQGAVRKLEMSVVFPRNYLVQQRNVILRVLITSTNTRVSGEEARASILKSFHADGKQLLSLEVTDPVPGLTYLICWEPLSRQEVAKLKGMATN